jgi:hypothetical protein
VSSAYPAVRPEPSQIRSSRENVAAAVSDLEFVRLPSNEAGRCQVVQDVETNGIAKKRPPFGDPNTLECIGAPAAS